jgi:hypothetical protein
MLFVHPVPPPSPPLSRRSHCRRQMSPRPTRLNETKWARERSREFCLNGDFHVTFRDLLHAANIRHGTADFHSEGRRAGEYFALKNPTDSAGSEPANFGTTGQHASSRPLKPVSLPVTLPTSILHGDYIAFVCFVWIYGSQSKQKLFRYTSLTYRFL